MQLPPDLAQRISCLAQSCGRSPESFLRDALSVWMEGGLSLPAPPIPETLETLESSSDLHRRFVPQHAAFSVYE